MKREKFRRLLSIVLMVVMVFTMNAAAFADTTTYSITISNANKGETYSIYKVFDATYDTQQQNHVAYTIDSTSDWYSLVSKSDSPFNVTATTATTTSGAVIYNVTLKDNKTASNITNWIASQTTLPSADFTVTATADGELTTNVNGAGYYYITTTTGSVVTLDSATPSVAVRDKNSEPVVDKEEITDGTAGIGSVVEYIATISDAAKVNNLVYHDVMSSGLTFNNDVVIKGMTAGTDYKVVTTESDKKHSSCTFEIEFTSDGMAKITENTIIEIKYTATVNEDAVIRSTGNPNEAYVTYGNAGVSTHDQTITYVFDFNLKKTDGTNELTGAEFTLSDSTGKEISFVKETAQDGSVSYRKATSTDTGTTTTIEAGTVRICGLDAGTYTLTETKAPDGYNRLTSTISVVIDDNGNVSLTTDSDSNGSAVNQDVIVVNKSGIILPSTGGVGTTIFYIVGGVLVLGAAVLFVTKKRLSSEN